MINILKKNKKLKSTNNILILPSDDKEMEKYIISNKTKLMEQVISSIEYSIKNDLIFAEVFKFDTTDYIVTISKDEYLTNINNIYNFYLKTEQYELCPRVVKLQSILSNNK